MPKPLLYNFRLSILASSINKTIMFFQNTFLDLIFLILFCFVLKMTVWGTTFKIQWAPKQDHKWTKWRPTAKKNNDKSWLIFVSENATTWRNAQWIGPSVLYFESVLHFCSILTALLSKDTWCFDCFFGSANYIEKKASESALRNPSQNQNKRVDPPDVSQCIWFLWLYLHNC